MVTAQKSTGHHCRPARKKKKKVKKNNARRRTGKTKISVPDEYRGITKLLGRNNVRRRHKVSY